jgi:hypothetical protein
MDPKRNPFRYGGDLNSSELVDRVEETALVEAAIRNGEKLFLIGPRRFGKTSILRAAEERLTARGAIVLRLNAEAFPSLDMMVEKIVSFAATHLKGKADMVLDRMKRYFSILKPEIKFNVVEQEFTVGIGAESSSDEDRPVTLLVDALNGLEKLASEQPASRPVGLILDEFQSVVARGGVPAEAQIRSAIQEHSRVGYVFSGSQTRLMTDMTMKHDRPLYRLGASRFIGPLPQADFSAYLRSQFRKGGFAVKDSSPIDAILELAEDVPYNVQMLAHNCWEALRDARGSKQPELTPALVQAVLEHTVQGLDPLFTQSWTRLTSVQQRTLLAVIRHGGSGMSSTAAAQSVGVSVSTVQSAIHSLHEHNILRDDPAEGRIRMKFEDPFFAQWIRMTVMA